MNSDLTVTDQFCGAGGSSQGARRLSKRVPGLTVKLAMNHWRTAIDTHIANFQDTIHECTDISACDPRRYFSTDILITSPECTNHSLSKGQKQVKAQLDMYDKGLLDPSAERSRATMWDVVRFAEVHKYKLIFVENVVEAKSWILFDSWLKAMHRLGYSHKCVYLNSMFCHPTPQSRDRMYICFWLKGNPEPDFNIMPNAFCPKCGHDVPSVQTWKNPQRKYGKHKKQYTYNCPRHGVILTPYYHAAFNVVDWSDRGKRIGDRKIPLSPNTIARIEYGLEKYKNHALIINNQHSTGIDCRVKADFEEFPTFGTVPFMNVVMPFIIKQEHTSSKDMHRSADDVFQTQATRQSNALVIPPAFVDLNRTGKLRPSTDPFGVQATVPKHSIITHEAFDSFISYYYGKHQASHITDPLGTVSTVERHGIVSGVKLRVEDCHYRTIKPREVKLAMAFDEDYIITGDGKAQVKQCGNAVTPPAMELLLERGVATLNG